MEISQEFKNGSVYKREILFDKHNCKIEIKDCFKDYKMINHDIIGYFHSEPDIKLETKKGNNEIVLKNKNNISLILDSKINKWNIKKNSYISQGYGHKILSSNLEIVYKKK